MDNSRASLKMIRPSVVLYGIPFAFLAIFFFYPLVEIFRLSFAANGQLDLTPLARLWQEPYYGRVLLFTFAQAAISTVLTLAVGLPLAYVFSHYTFVGKTLLHALSTIPFVLPTVVAAAAFMALVGPRGLLNTWLMATFGLAQPPIQLEQTLWLVLLAHVFYNTSIVLRLVGSFWSNLDPRLAEAARVLGANRWRVFYHVTWPLLRPSITAASLLVFLFCFTSFGVILMLGGPYFATLEVEIYRQAVHLFRLPIASALALLQMAITLAVMAVYTRVQNQQRVVLNLKPRQATQERVTNRRDAILVGAGMLVFFTILLAPLLALLERSAATPTGYTLDFYRALFTNQQQSILFVPPIEAMQNSLVFAVATVGLALPMGIICAHLLARPRQKLTRWIDPLLMLPLGTSAVTLGLGFLVALDTPPLNLRASPVLVPIAHTLVALPFVIRSVLPVLRSINTRLRDAAAVHGASPARVWREVDVPLSFRALVVGAVFAFTVSIGEFGATTLIARPQTPTLPLAIYRFLGQPGAQNYGQALAASAILMLVCTASFVLLERFRTNDVGEF